MQKKQGKLALVVKMSQPTASMIIHAMDRMFMDTSLHGRWIPDETIVRTLQNDISSNGCDQLTVAAFNRAFSIKSHEHSWSFHGTFSMNKKNNLKKHKLNTNAEKVHVAFYFCHSENSAATTSAPHPDWQRLWFDRGAKRMRKRTVRSTTKNDVAHDHRKWKIPPSNTNTTPTKKQLPTQQPIVSPVPNASCCSNVQKRHKCHCQWC